MSTNYEERRRKIDQAAPRERSWRALIVGAIVAVVVVAGLVWAWLANRNDTDQTQAAVASASTPKNATADGGGIVVNPGKAKPGAPTLVVYQDFQCPICKEVEDRTGATVTKLADEGKIKLEYHLRTFLDQNIKRALGGNEPNPDSSLRAAAAAACADNAGVFRAYHSEVFKNQPAQEGGGYTDEQLRTTFAKAAGLKGDKLTSFQACVDQGAMKGYATKMNQVGAKQGNEATPDYKLNGQTLDLQQIASDPSLIERRVAEATH